MALYGQSSKESSGAFLHVCAAAGSGKIKNWRIFHSYAQSTFVVPAAGRDEPRILSWVLLKEDFEDGFVPFTWSGSVNHDFRGMHHENCINRLFYVPFLGGVIVGGAVVDAGYCCDH